jgi:hypothetical protein
VVAAMKDEKKFYVKQKNAHFILQII